MYSEESLLGRALGNMWCLSLWDKPYHSAGTTAVSAVKHNVNCSTLVLRWFSTVQPNEQ